MNSPSPLVPQGSLLDQRNKGRARVRIAVFVVLAIHGVGLLALLMQGCKKEPETTVAEANPYTEPTNAAPVFEEPTNTPPPMPAVVPEPSNPPVVMEPPTSPPPPIPIAPTATEYKVVSGDTFSGIAKKFDLSVRAIMDANPGVEPTKLQVGQVLHIPPPAPSTGTTGVTAPPESAPGTQTYTVKSGDNLTIIARRFGVTVSALRSANNLTTDRIRVGQVLTIPVKAGSGTSAPSGQ